MWVLLDYDGEPVRYFDYPATGTVKVEVEQLSYDDLIELLGESE